MRGSGSRRTGHGTSRADAEGNWTTATLGDPRSQCRPPWPRPVGLVERSQREAAALR